MRQLPYCKYPTTSKKERNKILIEPFNISDINWFNVYENCYHCLKAISIDEVASKYMASLRRKSNHFIKYLSGTCETPDCLTDIKPEQWNTEEKRTAEFRVFKFATLRAHFVRTILWLRLICILPRRQNMASNREDEYHRGKLEHTQIISNSFSTPFFFSFFFSSCCKKLK